MSEIKWEIFEEKLGDWAPKIKPFYESGGFDTIYSYLKSEGRRGKSIYPHPRDTFNCFIATPLKELRVVVVGMSPYSTMSEGIVIANGIAMDCSYTGKLQPSLEKFYEGLEIEFKNGLDLNMIKSPSLSYLTKQGILLLNAALTVEDSKPRSHLKLWHPFIKFLFEEIFAIEGCPIILLGKSDVWKFESYTAPLQWIFKIEHPVSASYKESKWNTEGVFGKVSKLLRMNNSYEINWVLKGEIDYNDDLPF